MNKASVCIYIIKYVNEVILIILVLQFFLTKRLFCSYPGGDEEQKSLVKEKTHREKGNKGFFGLFKKNKKTPEQVCTPVSLFGFAISAICWLSY